MRAYPYSSHLHEGNLALALAPALTPAGIDETPLFFSGLAVHPQVLARGLLVLADITATRYYQYTPVAQRDPVLSAQGTTLRAECFSACNGVYARLDLLQDGFDGQIGFGTTNVDIGVALRTALASVRREDELHVQIGADGLAARAITQADAAAALGPAVRELPVKMPDRWVRALGNAAEIHRGMAPVFSLPRAQAQAFVATLPPATGKNQAGWLCPSRGGARLLPRSTPGSVYIAGLHRLSALKRVMTNLDALRFYMPAEGEPGPCMVEAELPGARLTLSLTAEAWQGYSGEGALLVSLAQGQLQADALCLQATLGFSAAIDALQLAQKWNMNRERAEAALALLAVAGKLGYDAHEAAWFHRELPDDPDRALRDNPRLAAAQKLVPAVQRTGEATWAVPSGDAEYRVTHAASGAARCTCTWYLKHQNSRGPCKHILAVQLKEGMA